LLTSGVLPDSEHEAKAIARLRKRIIFFIFISYLSYRP